MIYLENNNFQVGRHTVSHELKCFPVIIFQVEVSKMNLNMWWISGFLCAFFTLLD